MPGRTVKRLGQEPTMRPLETRNEHTANYALAYLRLLAGERGKLPTHSDVREPLAEKIRWRMDALIEAAGGRRMLTFAEIERSLLVMEEEETDDWGREQLRVARVALSRYVTGPEGKVYYAKPPTDLPFDPK